MELLLGCGSNRAKKLAYGERLGWAALTTLDNNAAHGPDFVHDMNNLPLPFPDDAFDEIHAYECLEHVGRQGDWEFFFAQWSDFWRMLEDGGLFFGTCPDISSRWLWGDPSHTRVIGPECLTFLSQPNYEQVGKTPMSDFRFCYKADFDLVHSQTNGEHYEFVLRAVKPSRVTSG